MWIQEKWKVKRNSENKNIDYIQGLVFLTQKIVFLQSFQK